MEKHLMHLREWFVHEINGEFSIRKVEINQGFVSGSLAKFVSGERSYLGKFEAKVFAWAKKRGYNPEYQYNNFIE